MPKFEDEAKPPFNINDIERSFYYETEAIPKTNRSSSKNAEDSTPELMQSIAESLKKDAEKAHKRLLRLI